MRILWILTLWIAPALCLAEGTKPYGYRSGYVSSVEEDKVEPPVEIPVYHVGPVKEPHWGDRLLDARLKREFKNQYEIRFGLTNTEQALDTFGKFDVIPGPQGVFLSLREQDQKRREFGEYVLRRLAEDHVDRFAKSSANVRPLYEMKEKFTNLNMQLRPSYRVKLRYNYSGNSLGVILENPLEIKANYELYMDPKAVGPSGKIFEAALNLEYPFNPRWDIATQYKSQDGVVTLLGTRKISPALKSTVSASTNTHGGGRTPRQNLYLVGFAWSL